MSTNFSGEFGGYELSDAQRAQAKRRRHEATRSISSSTRRACKKMARLSRFKIHAAYLNTDWDESGNALALIVRQTGRGQFAFAHGLVDLAALGTKDGYTKTGLSEIQLEEHLGRMSERLDFQETDPRFAAALIEEGVTLRLALDLEIPEDVHPVLAFIRGIPVEEHREQVPLGKDGELILMPGPHDDVDALLDHFDRVVGPQGYEFLPVPF